MNEYKIEEVQPIVLVDKLTKPFFFSQFEYSERRICLVKIILSNGITGWGEGYGPGSLVKAGIEKFAPLLIGENPLHHENLWQKMYRISYDYARKGIALSALSAIDIALWDIKGKILHQPVSTLLGGRKREQLKVYATGLYFTHGNNLKETLVKEALKYKAMGFSAVKMKVGLGIDTDVENVTAVRKAIGNEMQLMIDANHAFELREARILVDKLKDLDIFWFEEPLPNEDYDGYAELRKTSSIPIAGGECEYLKYGALEMLSKRCVDIFQPDTGACGGITEVKKMMAIANACQTNMTPHTWGTGIAIATNLHIMSNMDVIPDRMMQAEPMMELDCSPNRLRDELLVQNFRAVDGYLEVPSADGLGIEIDDQKLNGFLSAD